MIFYRGPSFINYLQRLVKIRLGDEYTFVETCGAFESEGLFVIVKDDQNAQHIYALMEGELELVDRL